MSFRSKGILTNVTYPSWKANKKGRAVSRTHNSWSPWREDEKATAVTACQAACQLSPHCPTEKMDWFQTRLALAFESTCPWVMLKSQQGIFLPVKLKLFESNTFHSSSPVPGLYVLATRSIFSFNHSKWYGQAKVLLLGFFCITVLVTFCVFIIEIRNDLSSIKILMKRALTNFQNINVYHWFIPGLYLHDNTKSWWPPSLLLYIYCHYYYCCNWWKIWD